MRMMRHSSHDGCHCKRPVCVQRAVTCGTCPPNRMINYQKALTNQSINWALRGHLTQLCAEMQSPRRRKSKNGVMLGRRVADHGESCVMFGRHFHTSAQTQTANGNAYFSSGWFLAMAWTCGRGALPCKSCFGNKAERLKRLPGWCQPIGGSVAPNVSGLSVGAAPEAAPIDGAQRPPRAVTGCSGPLKGANRYPGMP